MEAPFGKQIRLPNWVFLCLSKMVFVESWEGDVLTFCKVKSDHQLKSKLPVWCAAVGCCWCLLSMEPEMHKTYVVWKWESSKRDRKGEKTIKFVFCIISGWWFQICFIFTPKMGKIPILTNIFQRGWNHQLDILWSFFWGFDLPRIKPKPMAPGVETKILAEGDPWNACSLAEWPWG